MISMELMGAEELEARFVETAKDTSSELGKALNAAALMVKATAQKSIKKQGPGRADTRYQPKRNVVAASPGNSPNDDRGGLAKGIMVSTGRSMITKERVALVRSTANYSLALENGTGNMKPRPFMKPALNKNRAKIKKLISKAVSEGFGN